MSDEKDKEMVLTVVANNKKKDKKPSRKDHIEEDNIQDIKNDPVSRKIKIEFEAVFPGDEKKSDIEHFMLTLMAGMSSLNEIDDQDEDQLDKLPVNVKVGKRKLVKSTRQYLLNCSVVHED